MSLSVLGGLHLALIYTLLFLVLEGLIQFHGLLAEHGGGWAHGALVKRPSGHGIMAMAARSLGFLLDVGHGGLELLVGGALLTLANGGGGADAGGAGIEVGEGVGTLGGPKSESGDEVWDGAGSEITQRGDAGDLDGLAGRVEGGVDEPGVDGGDDEVLELAGRAKAQVLLQGGVGEVGTVTGESQEGKLTKLEGLGVAEGRQPGLIIGGGGAVGAPGSVGEDLQQPVVRGELGAIGQGGDRRRLQQLGEDECVGGRGGSRDEVGGGARRGGRFGKGEKGLELVREKRESACVAQGRCLCQGKVLILPVYPGKAHLQRVESLGLLHGGRKDPSTSLRRGEGKPATAAEMEAVVVVI
jgi:hypothetical protein